MMKQSARALRRQRHYQRMHKAGGLNLVSLMDIFTILVFFLMVNSSDVKVLQQNPEIKLPLSVAERPPADTVTIVVDESDIVVQGRTVATIAEIAGGDGLIAGLKEELDYLYQRRAGASDEAPGGRAITVMGDKDIEYRVLKRIMATCVESGFTGVALAVNRKVVEAPVE